MLSLFLSGVVLEGVNFLLARPGGRADISNEVGDGTPDQNKAALFQPPTQNLSLLNLLLECDNILLEGNRAWK